MNVEKIACNACGAPLEVPESANFVRCNHCSTQLAVKRQHSVTFTEVLDRLVERTDELSERLDDVQLQQELAALDRQWERQRIGELQLQQELAALDRQWELEREKFLITDQRGRHRLPTEGHSIRAGVITTVFGGVWIVFTLGIVSRVGAIGLPLPLCGVFFVVMGIASSSRTCNQAGRYRRAEQEYESLRADLLQQISCSRRDVN